MAMHDKTRAKKKELEERGMSDLPEELVLSFQVTLSNLYTQAFCSHATLMAGPS